MTKDLKAESNPRVFISHASEDKAFVHRLATDLRLSGIDAWVDFWEIKKGDSLIQKIFEEGLKGADYFMVVLSKSSVNKPWVKEELDIGLVEKISGNLKIIPIKLDDCEIPMALRATLYSDLSKMDNYSSEVKSIIDDMYGRNDKPDVGVRPDYIGTKLSFAYGLTLTDNSVFKTFYDFLYKPLDREGRYDAMFCEGNETVKYISETLQVSDIDVTESIGILNQQGLMQIKPIVASLGLLSGTDYGWERYLSNIFTGYEDAVQNILAILANEKNGESSKISSHLAIPHILVSTTMIRLSDQGVLKIIKLLNGSIYVAQVSPSIKRLIG